MANMRASLIIEARDRASAAFGRIADKSRALANSFKPIRQNANAADRAIDNVGRGSEWRFARIGAAARRAARDFVTWERAGFATGRMLRGIGGYAVQAAKWAGLAAAGGFGFFIGDVIRNASKFEQFQVILENTEGSAEAAKRAMGWVTDFAAKTPYELDQVMEAFVKLKAYGIDPTDGSLRVLGDTAAGMGKSVLDAVEMMADAQTGEFERLKEFGIRAKQQGDTVTFTYMMAGKEISRTSRKSAADIQKALVGILGERFQGMMDRQSKTLAGVWSNIKDQITQFQVEVANAGVFDLLKEKAEAVLSRMNAMAKDGSLKRWAETISDRLEVMIEKAWQFATQTDWAEVGRNLATVAQAVTEIATAFVWAIEKARLAAQTFNTVAAFAANPVATTRYYADQMRSSPANGRAASKWQAGTGKAAPAFKPVSPNWLKGGGAKIGGALDIRIKTDKGASASVTKLSSANKNVPIKVGKVQPA